MLLGVPLGTAISDSATLSNTAPKPDGSPAGGSITFRVYGPNDATCSGTPAFTSAAVPVSGNGTYSSGTFTPTAAGTYRWIASYSGDLPNTLAVAGACNDANEASVIISLNPTIATAQSFVPNDSATITVAAGGGDLAGNVVFKLYVNDATCAGTAAYTSASIPISGGSWQRALEDRAEQQHDVVRSNWNDVQLGRHVHLDEPGPPERDERVCEGALEHHRSEQRLVVHR